MIAPQSQSEPNPPKKTTIFKQPAQHIATDFSFQFHVYTLLNWHSNRSIASKWGGKVGSTDETNLGPHLARRSGKMSPDEDEVEHARQLPIEDEMSLRIHGDSIE